MKAQYAVRHVSDHYEVFRLSDGALQEVFCYRNETDRAKAFGIAMGARNDLNRAAANRSGMADEAKKHG